tara:strand:+ start:23 stop:310 length:288 start_codon:yes stop_codon:yes gene_type:complete
LGKERRLTELHKKIKHLSHTMIHWAEDNKIRNKRNGGYEIPSRSNVEWKKDFKFVAKLDSLLSDGVYLNQDEMKMCNELYKFYSQTYFKDMLRKK